MSAMSWPILGQMAGGSSGEPHLDLKPLDNSEAEDALRAAETVYQLAMRQMPEGVEVSQELLIYPEGEVDAVTITERDMEGLQPGKPLSNNIVDFYIRFLERGLSPEHGNRFYFFNSFFLTKLLQSTASTGLDPCKVDYEQLRKWTEEVNLFAKDYVFIPIVKSSHWSLVIICHLSSLTRPPGERMSPPCVFHLDPIEGQHESFEGLIRSYVLQAWMERFQVSSNGDQLLALCQMKYVEAKFSQQDNSQDCGLYVLNYIEAFLVESTSSDFIFPSSERGLHFGSSHFEPEVLGKRRHIQNLIVLSQRRARRCRVIEEVLQSTENLRFLLSHEGNSQACINDVQKVGPIVNGQSSKIIYASTHEDAIDAQHQQSTLISRGDNEPLNGSQIEPTEYETRCESLSPKQQHVEPTVQIVGPTNFNGPIFEAQHASSHEDAIDVQHQQSSRISRLDYEPLDGLVPRHAKGQRVIESFSNKLQHSGRAETPCMELSRVRTGKNKRGRNMTKEETWVLLSCKLEGGRFCKGRRGFTHWNLICEEIGEKLGSMTSANQCRLRYDTLLKAYKTYKEHCMKIEKTFFEITEKERLDLKLATTLSEEWYTTMDEICTKGKSQKRMKVVLDNVCRTIWVALCNFIPTRVFNSFSEDLQSTLLNLVQECSWKYELPKVSNKKYFYLEEVCQRLSIVQDGEPREILNYVLKLWELKLVSVADMHFEEGKDLARIDLWKGKRWFFELGLYEGISKEVLPKNPHLKTYSISFPIEQSSLQYIRVLSLVLRFELEHLDLREFPSLRSLAIGSCPKFNLVTGWEVATGLASLKILDCFSYCDFPEVRYLFSLREFEVSGRRSNKSAIPWQLSQFRQCAKLRRLWIRNDESLSEIADLENLKDLKFLEFLSLGGCTFSSIRGLSGLQALTTLRLQFCESLRRVPELGCLKGLTHLDMRCSGVEDIQGVEELHLLTSLDLCGCSSLKWLPFLGHLKALAYLNLSRTSVKEILGKEDMISLKTLHWV